MSPGLEGVLNIPSDPPEQIVTHWEHGCPAGTDGLLLVYSPLTSSHFAVKCVVSDWTSWSSCSESSGLGTQERTRMVIQEPHLMGMPCPDLSHTRWCKPGDLSETYLQLLKVTSPGVIMTGGTNYETGSLSTVESFPLACSIPDLPTGAINPIALSFAICSEVRTHDLPASHITPDACGVRWLRRGWRTVLVRPRPLSLCGLEVWHGSVVRALSVRV